MAASAVPTCDFVVFGGTGDLAMRKLLPALYLRDRGGQLPDGFRVIAVSRAGLGTHRIPRQGGCRAPQPPPAAVLADGRVAGFLQRLHYVSADADGSGDWAGLTGAARRRAERVRVFYLACASPAVRPDQPQLARLRPGQRAGAGRAGEADRRQTWRRRARPTTRSARSSASRRSTGSTTTWARRPCRTCSCCASPTCCFEPLWNAASVDHVQITVAESIGVGRRAGYYDGSGALRDMVQNHLLQLLCLVAMEPPSERGTATAIRDEKLKVLQALQPITGGQAAALAVRGQYTARG